MQVKGGKKIHLSWGKKKIKWCFTDMCHSSKQEASKYT